jgi:uncharacterized zinc-type alcohol dehydrogenase-like protein
VGHIRLKIADALGAEATVLSRSLEKEEEKEEDQEEGKRMGADNNFYSTSDPSTFKKLRGYFDVIINTVSVVLDFNKYMKLPSLNGTMVLVGRFIESIF